jgi:NADH:ubiquinone oxidoreductase subunit E
MLKCNVRSLSSDKNPCLSSYKNNCLINCKKITNLEMFKKLCEHSLSLKNNNCLMNCMKIPDLVIYKCLKGNVNSSSENTII